MGIKIRYCQNGSLLVYGLADDFQLSVQQLRILAEVYRDGEQSICARARLHRAALDHRTLPPGPVPSRHQQRLGASLTSSQRAALSRSLRRLHEHGLIEPLRAGALPTAVGRAFMAHLQSDSIWKRWSRDWLQLSGG
ncbi:MAG TPA: hypothetical protein VG826_21425 [Pirellulales bacterium]|nr:hypothetical protein [Pirellulales bacterium]